MDEFAGRHSDFLVSRPSFWEGMARILDFGGGLDQYLASNSATEADLLAMTADWGAVGADLDQAIAQWRQSQAERDGGQE